MSNSREPLADDYDDYDEDDHGGYCDCDECRYEEAQGNCSQFVSDGYVVCGALGSEDCDWCPFHDEIGQRVEVYQDEQ